MNKSTISKLFGEQIAIITAGTPFEVNADSDSDFDIVISELEHRIRRVMYCLWMDAQSKRLADYRESKMTTHFEQLYEFSFGVCKYDQDYSLNRGPESLAIGIINEKSRYTKQIERLRERYRRFKEICEQFHSEDKKLIVDYFEHYQMVDYETLRNVIRRNLKTVEAIYKDEGTKAEQEAKKQKLYE